MQFKYLFRPFALACALTATLSGCSSGTTDGDTNVERGSNKRRPTTTTAPGTPAGDSATSGLNRETGPHQPTGKEVYKAAADAKDRNHDGIAD
ncbi:hypothetical protein [Hymenobacter sp. IS2118]|uniref:hypothetical protein n=1 Tax=Hymenobacter sp. IS2118 TaxID=1505605 RepID=UPI000A96E9E5|nr:hypothetical protein [Hymenobacter sp. IS2118]